MALTGHVWEVQQQTLALTAFQDADFHFESSFLDKAGAPIDFSVNQEAQHWNLIMCIGPTVYGDISDAFEQQVGVAVAGGNCTFHIPATSMRALNCGNHPVELIAQGAVDAQMVLLAQGTLTVNGTAID